MNTKDLNKLKEWEEIKNFNLSWQTYGGDSFRGKLGKATEFNKLKKIISSGEIKSLNKL